MTTHRWKFIKETDKSSIYVDINLKKTKVVTEKYIYIHDGIYPDQDYNSIRRFKR